MRLRYFAGSRSAPVPSLGGSQVRHRPMVCAQISGPRGGVSRDVILDTGADDCVFSDRVAGLIGIDLTQAPQHVANLAGRGPVPCRYAEVTLRVSDGTETYEWEATVAFVSLPIVVPLLGHAGCLQFFDATFLGADHEIILVPNRSFSGRRS